MTVDAINRKYFFFNNKLLFTIYIQIYECFTIYISYCVNRLVLVVSCHVLIDNTVIGT